MAFFFFENLYPLSFKKFTVNCEIAKPFGFGAQNCSCPLKSQFFLHSQLNTPFCITAHVLLKGCLILTEGFFPLLYFSAVNNLVHSGALHNQEHDESSLASDCWLNWHELTSWKMWVRKCFKKTQSELPNHLFSRYVLPQDLFLLWDKGPTACIGVMLNCSSAHRCDSCQIKLSQKTQSLSLGNPTETRMCWLPQYWVHYVEITPFWSSLQREQPPGTSGVRAKLKAACNV